ncbi:hypothetical protein [Streptomyces chattanoogensis]|uniref:hypothetical protein n=1 Tax=Streptomyces chattanoogensis TaxID=66876 RepID=UPI0036A31A01
MTAATPTIALPRSVQGVKVHSRRLNGSCVPTFGSVAMDFEPVPAGGASSIEFAYTSQSEPAPLFEEFLAHGVMQELAGTDTEVPDARRGAPVSARVIVRAMPWH